MTLPRSLAVLALWTTLGCAHQAPLPPRSAAAPEVRQLNAGATANVFVVMGARPTPTASPAACCPCPAPRPAP